LVYPGDSSDVTIEDLFIIVVLYLHDLIEWLEDIIDPHLEDKKAEMWPIDDGIIVDLVEKGIFQISVKQVAEYKSA
jgi:hypothetical protein